MKKVVKKISSEVIYRTIEKGEHLSILYSYFGVVLTSKQIDKAIEKGIDLYSLLSHQPLNALQKKKVIDRLNTESFLNKFESDTHRKGVT